MSATFIVRFSTMQTLQGWEVIDRDGRAVAERDSRQSASGVAFRLNEIATTNPSALGAAIGKLH